LVVIKSDADLVEEELDVEAGSVLVNAVVDDDLEQRVPHGIQRVIHLTYSTFSRHGLEDVLVVPLAIQIRDLQMTRQASQWSRVASLKSIPFQRSEPSLPSGAGPPYFWHRYRSIPRVIEAELAIIAFRRKNPSARDAYSLCGLLRQCSR